MVIVCFWISIITSAYILNLLGCSTTKKGVFSMVTTTSPQTLKDFTSFANALHVPTLVINMPLHKKGQVNGYAFSMQPLYFKPLVQYMINVGWTMIYYLYEDYEGMDYVLFQMFV